MAKVTSRQRFAAGEEVSLHRRVGDWFSKAAAGKAVQTQTVDKDSVVQFDGLRDGEPFWLVGENDPDRAVSVTAKDAPPHKPVSSIPAELAGQTHPRSPTGSTEGPRDTDSDKNAEAERRSEAAKKGAETRRKNAAKRKRSAAGKKGAKARKSGKSKSGGQSARKK